MNEIRFKKAGIDDAPVLFNLLKQLAEDLGKAKYFTASLESITSFGFNSEPAFEAIIAWNKQAAVGFVLYFYEFSTWRGAPGIYVQDLFVSASARGLGLGGKLTLAALEEAAQKSAIYMRLSVHDSNEDGFDFYQAMGFEIVKNESLLVLEGESFEKLLVKDVE